MKKKDILSEYCTLQGVASKDEFGSLPSGGSILESNATNTLTWLAKEGIITSPKRGHYQLAEGQTPTPSFTKHEGIGNTPVKASKTALVVEDDPTPVEMDQTLLNGPCVASTESVDLSTLVFHPTQLRYTLSNGDVVEGHFLVSRTPHAFVVSQRGRKTFVVVPVNELHHDDPDINAFGEAVKCDHQVAGSHKAAADRLLKMLLICAYKHGHSDHLAGLVKPCPELCPIRELWASSVATLKGDFA